MTEPQERRSLARWHGSWEALRGVGVDGWLWLDSTEGGLHHGTSLPPTPPAGLTHVWGWRDDAATLVRVRADRDLPGGLVGAVLQPGDGRDAETVPVTITQGETWPETAGQISQHPSYADLLSGRLEMTAAAHDTRVSDTESLTCPLTFLRVLGP